MEKDIKTIVGYYTKKFNTRNPYVIADNLNIQVFKVPLGRLSGYYIYMKKHRCIFINSDIEDDNYKNIVMAHELGHAIMHKSENCYFMSNKTLLLTSKIEKQANIFAAELLISDELIRANSEYTSMQLSCITGYNLELIKLKLINLGREVCNLL